jgi:hypothetical protein
MCLLVFAALALSPIVWMHYFTLLVVPIALVRPRLSWLWFAPAIVQLAVIMPMHGVYADGNLAALGICWAGTAAIAVWVLRVDSSA